MTPSRLWIDCGTPTSSSSMHGSGVAVDTTEQLAVLCMALV